MNRLTTTSALLAALGATGPLLVASPGASASGYACHASSFPPAAPGFNGVTVPNNVPQGQPLAVDLSLIDLGNGLGSVLVDIDGRVLELPITPDGTTVFSSPPAHIACGAVISRTLTVSTDALTVGSHQVVFRLTDAAGTLASYRQQRVVAVTAPPSPAVPTTPGTTSPAPAPDLPPSVPPPSASVATTPLVWFTRIARVRGSVRVVVRTAGARTGARVRLDRQRRGRWVRTATRRVARDARARFTVTNRRLPRHTRIRVVLIDHGARVATSPSRRSR